MRQTDRNTHIHMIMLSTIMYTAYLHTERERERCRHTLRHTDNTTSVRYYMG